MAMVELRQVSFTYAGAEAAAIKNISFAVEAGELVCVCGATGSGKSTLLRLIKRELTPMGQLTGQVLLDGVPVASLPEDVSAFSIGYVMQRPDEQIVTDKVWHELAFGLENMGLSQQEMARRIAETAAYFGIESWYERLVSQLSGGQKQLLNLAAVMVMQPKVLILDEPTAQLDPIAAADFIATVHRLNRELGLTVLVIEHRLEELLPLCDRMVVLEDGCLLACDAPRKAVALLAGREELLLGMPSAARLHHALGLAGDSPLSLTEGRRMVERILQSVDGQGHCGERSETTAPDAPAGGATRCHAGSCRSSRAMAEPSQSNLCKSRRVENKRNTGNAPAMIGSGAKDSGSQKEKTHIPALCIHDAYFRYERHAPDVLCGASLTVASGEIVCLLGGNGSGKSTLLRLAAGLNRPQHGQVEVFGQKTSAYKGQSLYQECVALLPQDVQTVFLCDTVAEELRKGGCDPSALPFDLSHLLNRHPYDLSGGEQQLLALARVLAQKPRLLLMDEPTKGLDAGARQRLCGLLQTLKEKGMTILVVTHDVTFAAQCADRCAMLFRGQVVSEGTPKAFFAENLFYTTPVSRMTRGLFHDCLTEEEAAAALREVQRP